LPTIQKPPAWKDLARCLKCAKAFGLVSRHHHCRHCGGDFCGDCANKFTQIPKFGYIVSEVRVCDECYDIVQEEREAFKQQRLGGSGGGASRIPPKPQWIYSKVCFKCQVQFTQTNRDHHCRHCGQNFCGDCSNYFTPIPKFGYFLNKVRVCAECLQILRTTGQNTIAIQQVAAPLSSSQSSSSSVPTSFRDSPTSSKSSLDDDLV